MSEKLWCLKHCKLFERLSPEQLERIEVRSRSRSFSARSPIYLPAEKVDSVFLLARGLVKVSHLTSDGKEAILTYVEPGELFGELAMFDGEQQDDLVKAVEPSSVLMIPIDAMNQLMAERSDVALGITKMIGLRRQHIERRLKNLLFFSNRERLIHLLLDLSQQFGVSTEEGIKLRVKFSHQELANLIGSTRETITVLLGELKAEGRVAGGRCKIVITQPESLARSVHRQPPQLARPSPRLAPALVAG